MIIKIIKKRKYKNILFSKINIRTETNLYLDISGYIDKAAIISFMQKLQFESHTMNQ